MDIDWGRMLSQVAKRFPDKEAIVNIERDRRFTFMELHLLTNKICNMLKDRFGLARGDIFATILDNDNISLLHFWMFKGEATPAFLNYRDSFEEHIWQLDYASPKLCFIENELLDRYYDALRERSIEIICMDPVSGEREGVFYFWDLLENASDAETGVIKDFEDETVLIRFTGGTTGKGKSAMYTIRNLMGPMGAMHGFYEELITRRTRFLNITPLSHATSLFVLPIYFKGATLVTMNVPDLKAFLANVQNEKITSTLLVPTILYRFLEVEVEKMFDLSSLDMVFYGASPMSPDKLRGLQKKFGNIFIQAYGSTEAVPPVTILGKEEHADESEEGIARLSSAGCVCPGWEVFIADDDGNEIAEGETGEIWIRGPGVIKGYYQNPEQTDAEFKDGYWLSGDMGYMDRKGYVYIVDRKKDMIITGGFNVYAAEVEDSLNSHPAVLMAAVVGIPHPEWGEAIHAEVILREGEQVEELDLIEWCKDKKGKYKAPKSITFVSELPLSAAGKVLRKNVRDKYWKDEERRVH